MNADGRIETAVTCSRCRDADEPVGLGSRWHLGSDTEAMTGMLAARLVEHGAIGWEATLVDVCPPLAELRPALPREVAARSIPPGTGPSANRAPAT